MILEFKPKEKTSRVRGELELPIPLRVLKISLKNQPLFREDLTKFTLRRQPETKLGLRLVSLGQKRRAVA
mgnify:CR=1 FL=1